MLDRDGETTWWTYTYCNINIMTFIVSLWLVIKGTERRSSWGAE